MERFYRGLRNPLADQTSYHQTFILSNLHIPIAPIACLYHKYGGLSNLQTLKTPYKFAPKLWKTITKSYKRFG